MYKDDLNAKFYLVFKSVPYPTPQVALGLLIHKIDITGLHTAGH